MNIDRAIELLSMHSIEASVIVEALKRNEEDMTTQQKQAVEDVLESMPCTCFINVWEW